MGTVRHLTPRAFMPYRTLEKDGTVSEGFAERPVRERLPIFIGFRRPSEGMVAWILTIRVGRRMAVVRWSYGRLRVTTWATPRRSRRV
jgi:Ribonuclease G/E